MPPATAAAEDIQMPQHADALQSNSSHAQQAQPAQQPLNFQQQAMQQAPLLMQQPGFDSCEKLEQKLQGQAGNQVWPQDDKYVQAQVQSQLPQQLQDQQPSARCRGPRRRPTADAAGLACFGKGVQEEQQGRMTQSGQLQTGVLQQPPAMGPAPVPELFEVRHYQKSFSVNTEFKTLPRVPFCLLSSDRSHHHHHLYVEFAGVPGMAARKRNRHIGSAPGLPGQVVPEDATWQNKKTEENAGCVTISSLSAWLVICLSICLYASLFVLIYITVCLFACLHTAYVRLYHLCLSKGP